MADSHRPTTLSRKVESDKANVTHDEQSFADEKNGVIGGGDYSGAVAKTDPAEIALVRKLDYMIMVSGILLLREENLKLTVIANLVGHVFPQLLGQKRPPSSSSERPRG